MYKMSANAQLINELANTSNKLWCQAIVATDAAATFEEYILARRWERTCAETTNMLERQFAKTFKFNK